MPLLLDCTTRKGTVDTFFLYQRAFVIDMKTEVLTRLSLLQRPADGQPSPEERHVLDGWRKKLVNAMKQGCARLSRSLGRECQTPVRALVGVPGMELNLMAHHLCPGACSPMEAPRDCSGMCAHGMCEWTGFPLIPSYSLFAATIWCCP